jgi:prolyl-tRNA synthetase
MLKCISRNLPQIKFDKICQLNNQKINIKSLIKFYFSFSLMDSNLALSTKEETIKFLEINKINFFVEDHDKADTVQEGLDKVKTDKIAKESFTFCKNLFLKNKAGGFYFIAAHPTSQTDFKLLHKLFNAKSGNIRNAEKDQLISYLKVQPGSVNPFSLLNLKESQKSEVKFMLDKAIVSEYVAIHPMVNTSTVFIKTADLVNLLEKNKINVNHLELKEPEESASANNTANSTPVAKKVEKDKKPAEDEGKSKLAVSCGKHEDFAEWYSETITKSEMIDYYEISGCYILRPWSYAIWEIIQKFFDDKIKEIGVENAYFPLFVSERALNKEKDHIEGFSPEVAWVTRSGDKKLENPIAIRPTSETIMYPSFAKWIRSHRDLPLKLNQWTNVVRWEFKNPTPFIRTREFLWQEGHTAHTTLEEADKQVFDILEFYRQVYEDVLAVPVIPGRKTENEKFAGGFYTTTVETMIPANGKGIQCATSHNLGQNFSKMFDINYLDEKQNKLQAWQTSWGMTTRTIGVMVMTHGDDQGLVLPPRVAPIQVILIPIITTKDNPEPIKNKLHEVAKGLKSNGVRIKVDDGDLHNPGWKFSHWELKGVPVRIEFGDKDMQKEQVTIVCRDNKEKFTCKYDEINEKIKELLEVIQKRMFQKAKDELNKKTAEAYDYDQFIKLVTDKNIVLTPWCNVKECEENVKKRVKDAYSDKADDENTPATAKTLCIPLEQKPLKETDKCFFCGKKAEVHVFWGRTY